MATLNIQSVDIEVQGNGVSFTTGGASLETTPLASVPETSTADTAIVTKDGVPKQIPTEDLKTSIGVPTSADEISFDPDATAYLESDNVQDAVDELATKMSGKVGRLAADVSGLAIDISDGHGWYYSNEITVNLPTGAIPISASWYGIFDAGSFPQIRDNAKIIFQAGRAMTLGSSRTVIVGYYIP